MESNEHAHVQSSTESAVCVVNKTPGDTVMVDSFDCDMQKNKNMVDENTKMVRPIYRQDVVMRQDGMLGVVTEVAGDSDSESDVTDDEEDESDDDSDDDEEEQEGEEEEQEEEEGEDKEEENIEKGDDENRNRDASESGNERKNAENHREGSLIADHARVLWLDDSETAQHLNEINVVDRGFLHGDYVASASDPTGQIGLVVNVEISVDLLASDGTTVRDVSSRDLKRIRNVTVGDHVVLGPWLGRVDDVYDNVTVQLDDGSVYKVMGAEPLRLRPIAKNLLEDGHCPYHPGQRVRASSTSVFKNAKLLSAASKSEASKANRLEGTVTKVAAASVYIHWIASAGYGPESTKSPSEEQNPKDLKLLSCFNHANWQLGDWCHFPSLAQSSSTPLHKGFSKLILQNEFGCAHSECVSEEVQVEVSNGNGESMDLDVANTEGRAVETDQNNAQSKSKSCGGSLSVSKEVLREGWPIHRKKLRKVGLGLKRDKKQRKKEETYERALMIVNTRTKVDVAWQDGTVQQGLHSTSLIPVESPGDHDFVAEQYVVEKSADDNDGISEVTRVGVVRSVNAKEKTACVRWLKPVARPEDPREFDKEEIVSVYELESHPDYDYCYGDLVVRLSQVFVPAEASPFQSVGDEKMPSDSNGVMKDAEEGLSQTKEDVTHFEEASVDFSDLSWVGNITGLRNGDIEVTWADEMVSMVGPQAIYVVGRDDDDASIVGGSEISDAASWETVEDDDTNVIEQAEQGLESHNGTHANFEIGENTIFEDNNPGHNGPLAIPLAAIGFVTRLASGIFSRGQRDRDIYESDVTGEICAMNMQSTRYISDERPYGNSSCGSSVVDNITGQKTLDQCKETGSAASTNLLEAAEALCSLKDVEPDAKPHDPLCHEDDASGFKRFDTTKDPLDHFFLGANSPGNSGRKWLKKVQQDWNVLQNNLPDSIYVRVYEDRMDLLRAVIVGAYGTPYQDGLFFFDFHLPPEYPDVPPSAHYHSGGWRINPNLYEEGKVCLSLLNTWTGRGNEVWDPKSSSILQVLVSLQGLVLNSRPYFNEAGYDKQVGTVEGEKNSLSYNENTFLLNCKTIMYLIRRPPKDFEPLVREHFKQRAYYILKTCDAYMKGYLIGSLAKDASLTDKSEPNANSVGFKLMLAKIVPKLISAFTEVGADCQEFEHLKQS